MDKEQAVTLVEYNAWANRRILLKVAHLASTNLLAKTALSHDTYHHSEIGQHLATLGQSPKDLDFIKFVARAKP